MPGTELSGSAAPPVFPHMVFNERRWLNPNLASTTIARAVPCSSSPALLPLLFSANTVCWRPAALISNTLCRVGDTKLTSFYRPAGGSGSLYMLPGTRRLALLLRGRHGGLSVSM